MDDESHCFGEGEPCSLGLEEELFVVDSNDGRLLNVGADVLEQLGELERGEVKSELHRSQISSSPTSARRLTRPSRSCASCAPRCSPQASA